MSLSTKKLDRRRRSKIMDTIFHVGMSKAGSTALQDSLLASYDTLVEHKVLYPKNAPSAKFNNHELLLYAFGSFDRQPSHVRARHPSEQELFSAFNDHVTSIRAQIASHSPNCLVLSAEHMWRSLPIDKEGRSVQDLKELWGERITLSAYIRRPSARYLSALQQGLRRGLFFQPPAPTYKKPISILEEVFGKQTVVPAVLDRSLMKGGSISIDFAERYLKQYGVEPLKLEEPKRSNQSVSAAAMSLLDKFASQRNIGKATTVNVQDLRREIQRAERCLNLTKPKIKQGAADRIDYSSTEPVWLRDQYGIEFPDFDYARLEKGRAHELAREETLDTLIEVDPDEFQSLVSHLARRAKKKQVRSFARQFRAPSKSFWLRLTGGK